MTQRKQADFALIRQRVTMQMLLDHYQITDLKREGNELRGACPICGAGKRPFAVNLSKSIFQCFSCQVKGNVIDLVAKKEGCSLREAGLKIWEWFSLDEETSSPTAPSPPEPRGEPEAKALTVEERLERLEQMFALIFSEGLLEKIGRKEQ